MYGKPEIDEWGGSVVIDDKITLGINFAVDSFNVNKQIFTDIKWVIAFNGSERALKQYHVLYEYLKERG